MCALLGDIIHRPAFSLFSDWLLCKVHTNSYQISVWWQLKRLSVRTNIRPRSYSPIPHPGSLQPYTVYIFIFIRSYSPIPHPGSLQPYIYIFIFIRSYSPIPHPGSLQPYIYIHIHSFIFTDPSPRFTSTIYIYHMYISSIPCQSWQGMVKFDIILINCFFTYMYLIILLFLM